MIDFDNLKHCLVCGAGLEYSKSSYRSDCKCDKFVLSKSTISDCFNYLMIDLSDIIVVLDENVLWLYHNDGDFCVKAENLLSKVKPELIGSFDFSNIKELEAQIKTYLAFQ